MPITLRRGAIAWVIALCAIAQLARAQAPKADPLQPICPDGATPIVDSSVVPVVISPGTAWNRRIYTDAERQRILYYADAIRQHFVPPQSLGAVPLLVEANTRTWGGEPSLHSAVGGKLVLVVKSNGRLREAFWQVLPMSTSFARSLFAAAVVADTSHDFEGIPGAESQHGDDTLVVQTRITTSYRSQSDLPLMRANLAQYIPESGPQMIKKGGLYYPSNAQNIKAENDGEMQVIVGSTGRAIMTLSQITRIDYRDFVNTMRGAIESSVLQPARSGGCAVPSVMMYRFSFTIDRP